MRLFCIAMRFLTIIPFPCANEWQQGDLGRSMRWFPLAGLCIGGLLALSDRLFTLIVPLPLASLLLVTLLAIITGALHLDGIADVADGFGARGDRERFLAVMKDSATGAIGVTALLLHLMLKYQAVLHLPSESRWPAIIIFPAVGRLCMVLMTAGARSARETGLGAVFAPDVKRAEITMAVLTTMAAAVLLAGWQGLVAALGGVLFTFAVKRYFHQRLGGITGDIIGAAGEVSELLFLLSYIVLKGV